MRYYKHVTDNIIDYIGTGDGEGIDITETEYIAILEAFNNRPNDTNTQYYVLTADPFGYEAIERPEPLPEPISEEQAFINRLIEEVNS